MTPPTDLVSIVIPTRNRREPLMRLLRSLERQTVGAAAFEVIVVDDAGTDGTANELDGLETPYSLRVMRAQGNGPAVARNIGARAAAHPLLLFLDDDVAAEPPLVAEHLAAHPPGSARAVVGAYYPEHRPTRDPFRILSRNWWEETFAEMGRAGHRASYRDLLSGNLSTPRTAFLEWGGFDEGFKGVRCEDWELGARLLRSGVPILYRARAAATHFEFETLSLPRALRDARKEGRGFARLDRLHPELAWERAGDGPLRDGRLKRLVYRAARDAGPLGDLATAGLRMLLTPLSALKLRRSWRHLYGILHLYAFWRGYHDPLNDVPRPVDTSKEPWDDTTLDVEIAEGWAAGTGALDQLRPSAVRICWRGRPIGTIQGKSGMERLQGHHLRSLLANELAAPLRQVLLEDEGLRHHSGSGRR